MASLLVTDRLRGTPSAEDPSASRSSTRLAARAHVASLAIGYVGLLALLRGTWFRGDDFEFLANRVGRDTMFSIWYPHNEHWSTGPILVWRALYAVVGVTSALPYYAVALLAHVAVAHLLWRLMCRARVQPWTATGLAAVMVFLGTGFENITWAFQLGFMGSFALGLAGLLCCLRDDRVSIAAGVAFLLAALTFAGIALPCVAGAVVLLLLRHRWVRAGAYAAVAGVVYGAWYLAWGSQAPPSPHTQGRLTRLAAAPGWSWQLVNRGLEDLLSLPGTGAVLTTGLLVAVLLVLRRRIISRDTAVLSQRFLVCAALMATLVIQAVTLAASRDDISPPGTSRYLYFVVALLLPVIGVLLDRVRPLRLGQPVSHGRPRRSRFHTGALAVSALLAYLVVVQGITLAAQERQFEAPQLRSDVWGLAALVRAHRPIADVSLAVDLNRRSITKWVREGALPARGASAQSLLDAQALGQVVVSRERPEGTTGSLVLAGRQVPLTAGSCAASDPTPLGEAGIVTVGPRTTLSVTNQQPGNLRYQVLQGTDAGSRTLTVPAQPHASLWITSTEALTLRIVSETGAEVTFCAPR